MGDIPHGDILRGIFVSQYCISVIALPFFAALCGQLG